MADSIPFVIGGATYNAPPLNLNGYRLAVGLMGRNALLPNTDEGIANLPRILAASLTRNDKTQTEAWISENMSGAEYGEAANQLLELLFISGFTRPTKDAKPGEDQAASQTGTI